MSEPVPGYGSRAYSLSTDRSLYDILDKLVYICNSYVFIHFSTITHYPGR